MDKVAMSGMMYGLGSVVDFKPAEFQIECMSINDDLLPTTMRLVGRGWGIVVCRQGGWVVDTRVEPMVICDSCRELVPWILHQEMIHEVSMTWEIVSP